MRWFWLFIALLAVLTGVLYTQRVRHERAEIAAMQAQAESSTPSTATRRSRTQDRTPQTDRQPDPVTDKQPEPEPEPELEPEPQEAEPAPVEPVVEMQTASDDQPADGFNPSELLDMFRTAAAEEQPLSESETESNPEPESSPAPIEQALAQAAAQQTEQQATQQPDQQPDETNAPEPKAPPSYELRPDGSFKVLDANSWVQGAGTDDEPYVLSWGVLKSIEKLYEPRAGKDILPDWLDLLDGKSVLIEGNTLVPVVATTTRELLVMQNPWDGCCIGVPPTPYDAIEVVLNHDVDFGNSAVGYGTVQGTFYLDPYVVDGWVLGIYIIEDAKYRSGDGVAFPEF